MNALVVADGEVPERARLDASWPGWDVDLGLVVAADGGARGAAALGLPAHLIVGDADSMTPAELARSKADGVRTRIHPRTKDASDAELAIGEAVAAGAMSITLVGALGGVRLDHALANVLLLALERPGGGRLAILDGTTRVQLLRPTPSGRGELALDGRVGDLVSLLPLGDVEGVITEGLEYALHDDRLIAGSTRGLSNVRVAPQARVSLARGRLLIVETALGPETRRSPAGGAR